MNSREESFFRWIVTHRRRVLALHVAIAAFTAVGLSRLRVDYSAEQFFLFQGPTREVFEEFKSHFPREDLQVTALVGIAGPISMGDFRTLEGLAASFEAEGLESVRWLGNTELPETVIEDGDPAIRFVRLADEPGLSAARIRVMTRERSDQAPWSGFLWNADQTVFAVHGYLAPEDNTDAHRRSLVPRLEAEVMASAGPRRRIVLTGLPTLRATVPVALETDLVKLIGLGILASFFVLYGFLRRLSLVLICLAAVVPAILLTLGMLGWIGRPMSVLGSFMPIAVLLVGASDAVHLVMGTRKEWAVGHDSATGVVNAFAALARACFYTSLTTALGFAGLVATRIGIFGEFGVVTALAVVATFLVTMTLLPALLSWASDAPGLPGGSLEPTRPLLGRVTGVIADNPAGVCALFGILFAGGVALGSGLRVEAFLIDDLKADDPLMEELAWVENAGFGVFQVNVYLRGMDDGGHSPQMLQWTEEFQKFFDSDSVVVGSVALPSFVLELGDAFGVGEVATAPNGPERWASWTSAQVRELLFLADMRGDDVVADIYRREEGTGQVILTVRDVGSTQLARFFDRLEARLSAAPPPVGTAHVTGTVRLSQVLWDELLSRFLPGVMFSLGLVWLALASMFRSVRWGLLALIPNLVPLALLAGFMRLGGFELKPSTVIVFAIAFGIIADDTIHFLAALRRRLSVETSLERATSGAVLDVGHTLFVTTAVVGIGFAVLTASRFQALFLMGFLTSSAAVFALFADLLGFPALLSLLSRWTSLGAPFERTDP